MPQALPMLAYYAAGTAGATAGVFSTSWALAASFVTSVVLADYQKQSAADKARAQAARDRTVNIRSGVAPRKLVLGTVRLGGAVMYGEFVGAELEYLDMITALHHGDAGALTEVLGVYLDDEFVPASSLTSGVPMTGKYSGAGAIAISLTEIQTLTASATITLPLLPVGDVYAIQNLGGTGVGADASHAPLTVASVAGYVVTLSEPITGEVWVTYRTNDDPRVPLRLQWTTGSSTQATTTWAGVATPKWTADHRLRGVSYLRTLMLTEDRVFATGTPQVSLVCRAADGVWDPRTSTTVNGTSNPALLAAWFRRLPKADGGFGVPFDWIDWATVATAANICDELLSVKKLDGTGYENVKRYECNTLLNLELPAADNLRVILGAMAGDFPFTGGKYRCYAGAFRAAAVTLTDDDVSGDAPINFAPSNGPAAPPNTITARIYNRAKAWVEDGVPAVVNSTYVAADGREEVMEIDLPACTDTRQANYLMGVRLEQMRPAMAGTLTVKGKGANLALLDTVQLSLVGYEALAGRTFEIRRRTNHWNGTYTIEVSEVKASTYALDADRFTPPSTNDPGDTSGLWNVTPVTLTSVVNATLLQSDGTHLDRALVTWAAHPQSLVNPNGKIEVRYRAPGYEWVYAAPVPGDQTTTYIGPLGVGMVIFVEARALNALGVPSAWSGIDPFTVTGANDVPPNVTGLAFEIKPGQVVVKWDDLPGFETELRYSAVPGSWAGATFLWAGTGTDYKHARPPNGTYRVWAAHRNLNFYSAAPQHVDITVDDSIDAGSTSSGTLVLSTSAAPYFTFNSGTTHTSTTPDLVITAQRVGAAVGNIVFTATAYNAASGGTSLGAVTLTGTGDARTLSAANFVAPGSAGSVRRVDITASIPGLPSAVDSLSIYRSDPTVTTAVLVLSNPRATVATDVNGNGGDFSTAVTAAGAYVGNGTSAVLDQTSSYTWTISADAGVTATINGGAGPVSAAATITVAVSAMTVPVGAVVVSMTPTGGGATTSASFVVTKAPASGTGWTAYFDPPDLTLPVDAAGNVSSFATATSDFYILNAINQLDDTANWTKSISARNVVAELVGSRVNIKQWLELGTVGASTLASFSLPASWTRAGTTVHGNGVFINLGWNSGSAWTVVKRSTDYLAWVDKTVPSGRWDVGDYGNGRFLALQQTAVSANALTSTDGGNTFSSYAMPVSAQWTDLRWGGDRWMATQTSSATGYWSATGAAGSWAAITLGAGWTLPGFGAGTWVSKDPSDAMRYSINAGTSWTLIPGALGPAYIGASFRGRLFLAYGTITTNKVLYTEGGGVWKHATVPQNYASPRGLLVVNDVLYLLGNDGKLQYTADGLTWRYAGTITSTAGVLPSRTGSDGIDIDFLPYTDVLSTSTPFLKVALASTSDTVASVRLTATKPGQEDIVRTLLVYKGQAARVVYVASADPSTLYIPATKDGKATDFSAAIVTGKVRADGQDVTGLYTISWTASGMTPSSGTGSVVTFTAMADGTDSTLINWVASRPGYDDVTGQTAVVKLKGTEPSGPRKGTNFRGFTQAATSLSLKIQGDGQWALKVGSGSYVVQDAWSLPIGSANNSRYVLVTTPPEGAFTSGTVDTFLALTTDREWVFSNSSPGTHRRTFSVVIASDAVGSNAVENLGSFTLIVP